MSSIYLIDYYSNNAKGKFQKVSPLFKILFFGLVLFSIVFSQSLFFLILTIFLIYFLLYIGNLPLKTIFKWALYPTFFALIFAFSQSNLILSTRTILRAFNSASLALFISFTTPYYELFGVFGKRFPFLSSIFFLTYRYFFLLVSSIQNKQKIMKIRGANNKKIENTGRFIGYFIIDLINKSEKIYNALTVRGFNGKMSYQNKLEFSITGLFLVFSGIFIFLVNFFI